MVEKTRDGGPKGPPSDSRGRLDFNPIADFPRAWRPPDPV